MASPTTAMADGGARLAGELATAKGTARGEERRKGGAHRAATKSLRQLRSAEVAGDDGGHRRQRRKGAARSAPRSGSRLALTDGDWVDDGGGDDGLDGEANGARWPRGQSRRGGEHARVRERGKLEGESGGEWERRRGRAGEWVEVGGEEVEASRGGALTHPRRCRRGGRAASRPCSGAHQGNRKGGRASGSWAGQAGEVGRPAGMGRSPRGGQGLSLPLFFSPFF